MFRERYSMSFVKVGFIIGFLCLTACGFQPIYYTPEGDTSVQSLTAQIRILPVPEETGRLMVQTLKNTLNPENISVPKTYDLAVQLSKHVNTDQGILNDNTSTRATMTMTASYVLRDKDGRTVISDSTFAMGSYNILTVPYSTVTAEQATERRLIKILAEKISLRMAHYFKTKTDEAEKSAN